MALMWLGLSRSGLPVQATNTDLNIRLTPLEPLDAKGFKSVMAQLGTVAA